MQTQDICNALPKEGKINLAFDYYSSCDIRVCCYCFMNLEELELEQNQITKRVKEMGHGVGLPNESYGQVCY